MTDEKQLGGADAARSRLSGVSTVLATVLICIATIIAACLVSNWRPMLSEGLGSAAQLVGQAYADEGIGDESDGLTEQVILSPTGVDETPVEAEAPLDDASSQESAALDSEIDLVVQVDEPAPVTIGENAAFEAEPLPDELMPVADDSAGTEEDVGTDESATAPELPGVPAEDAEQAPSESNAVEPADVPSAPDASTAVEEQSEEPVDVGAAVSSDAKAARGEPDVLEEEFFYEPWADLSRVDTKPFGDVTVMLRASSASASNVSIAQNLIKAGIESYTVANAVDPALELTRDDIREAFANVTYGDPELFYVAPNFSISYARDSSNQFIYATDSNGDVKIGSDGNPAKVVNGITLRYIVNEDELPAYAAAVEAGVDRAVAWADYATTDAQKVQAIHDYLVRTIVYTSTGSYTPPSGFTDTGYRQNEVYTAYGALVSGHAVCQGYASAFKLIMNRLGIGCVFVPSQSMGHAWNMVMVDGSWYHVDATWDDHAPDSSDVDDGFYDVVDRIYFLKSDRYFENHSHYDWTSDYAASSDAVIDTWPEYLGPDSFSPGAVSQGWSQSGSCEWQVADGLLTVRPLGNGDSGTLGKVAHYTQPWLYADETINAVRFLPGTSLQGGSTGLFNSCDDAISIDMTGLDAAGATVQELLSGCGSLEQVALPDALTNWGAGDLSGVPSSLVVKCTAGSDVASAALGYGYAVAYRASDISPSFYIVPIEDSWPYNAGSVVTPQITAYDGLRQLVEGTDYDVAYSDNTAPGTGHAVVTGKGAYIGLTTLDFTITGGSSSGSGESSGESGGTSGSGESGGSSSSSSESSSGNGGASSGEPSSGGSGNASSGGSTSGSPSSGTPKPAAKQPIVRASVTRGPASFVYDGAVHYPEVAVKLNGTTLKYGTDYTITWPQSPTYGTQTAIITGQGTYSGTLEFTYGIWFADTPSQTWYMQQGWLDYVVTNGLMTGTKTASGTLTGQFVPDGNVTRAQMATVLYRWANPASDATTNPANYAASKTFSDVADYAYYTAAVEWCYVNGIVTGYGDTGTFGPEDPITREQLATMIYRFARHFGADASYSGSALKGKSDVGKISGWAYDAMCWCYSKGVITGYEGTTLLDPGGLATRAQMAKIVTVTVRDVL